MHIIFTGGGTLGPVTPLIAVLRAIRQRRPDATFSWIGTAEGPEAVVVRAADVPFHPISAGKLRRYVSLQNLTDAFRIVHGFFQARTSLQASKADVVVSAGGFVGVPVAWAAWTLGIPVHVHQQDVVPGLTNRLTMPVAASLSVALESSLKDFARHHPVWTGNPVRPEVLAGSKDGAMQKFGLDPQVPTLLVLGGGTGAGGINQLVRATLPKLTAQANVIHVAGKGKTDGTTSPRYFQTDLLMDDLPNAYAAADLVVTRAGMGSLTELAALGKAALIVPMPDSHQEKNAAAYAAVAGAPVLAEGQATPDSFADTVLDLLKNEHRRREIGDAMRKTHRPDAAERVAEMVLVDAEKRR